MFYFKFLFRKSILILFLCLFIVLGFKGGYSKLNNEYDEKTTIKHVNYGYTVDILDSIFKSKLSDSVKYVALGEVSHGSYEPMAFKSEMIKYLVQKRKFRKILFEQWDLTKTSVIRDYILKSQKIEAGPIKTWIDNDNSTQAYQTVYLELFSWLLEYNLQNPNDKVEVAGFEVANDLSIIKYVLNRFIIPLDRAESQKIIIQLESLQSDLGKISVILNWCEKNKKLLKESLSGDELFWLDFHIQNSKGGVSYATKKHFSNQSVESMLYRDSLLFENVKYLDNNSKTIIWAHNAHVIRTSVKFMGFYLNKYLGNKYFIIATDFSNYANSEITIDDPLHPGKKRYTEKIIKSSSGTYAKKLINDLGKPEGIYFHDELIKNKITGNVNIIDANGMHIVSPSESKMFDAIMVFKNIFSRKY